MKHLELEGVKCDADSTAITQGGHCVVCGDLCDECTLVNSDGLVYGFYIGEEPILGSCQACKPDSDFDTTTNSCRCNEKFFSDLSAGRCTSCSNDCASCETFASCTQCNEFYVLESNELGDAFCVPEPCDDGQYFHKFFKRCADCHQSCLTCSLDGSKCLSCPERQTVEDDVCTQCGPGCLECSSVTECLTCEVNATLSISQDQKQCACKDGFFMDNQTGSCKECGKTCATCSDASQCDSCPRGLDLGLTICLECSDGQTIVADTCVQCGTLCQECLSPDICNECKANAEFGKVFQACLCKDGFHFNADTNACEPCQENCQTCQEADSCQVCQDGFVLRDSICQKCASNEYVQGGECISCGVNCLECDGPDKCITCAPFSEINDSGVCQCIDGKFFDQDVNGCVDCHESCETCENLDKCKTCPDGLTLGDSICLSCESDEFSSGDSCVKCGTECLSCDSGPNQCLQCSPNAELLDGVCHCKDGYFMDIGSQMCMRCGDTCATCVDAIKCEICPKGFDLGLTICLKCSDGLSVVGDECVQCGALCLHCSSPDTCNECTANAEFYQANTSCLCKDGFHLNADTNACEPCQENCQTCQEADACQVCQDGFVLRDSICQKCASNEYFQGGECMSCGVSCLECDGPNKCITCAPFSETNDSGVCQCIDGKFFERDTNGCVDCHESCQTCENLDKCKTCPDGLTLGDSICLSCQSDEFASGDSCVKCGTECLSCDSGPNQCLQCSPDAELLDGKCHCKDGYFMDTDSQKCMKCSDTCETCEASDKCKSCPPDFELGDTICIQCGQAETIVGDQCQKCGPGCLQCSDSDTCTQCESNSGLNSEAQCVCRDGFFRDPTSKSCTPCDDSCKTCDELDTCKTCADGFEMGNSVCLSCALNEFIEGDKCQPCGRGCLECDSGPDQCLVCDKQTKLASGKCQCKKSYYLDEASDICLPCGQDCLTCSTAEQCDTCREGTVKQDGKCQACEQDQYIAGDECKACSSTLPNCQECTRGAGRRELTCTSCLADFVTNAQGQCSCPDGRYLDAVAGKCLTCSENCAKCDSVGTCEECSLGSFFGATRCVNCQAFGSAFWLNGDRCQPCPQNCLQCELRTGKCEKCAATFSLRQFNNNYLCSCGKGTYFDQQVGECTACMANCDVCLDRSICADCSTGYQLAFDGQVCKAKQVDEDGAAADGGDGGDYDTSQDKTDKSSQVEDGAKVVKEQAAENGGSNNDLFLTIVVSVSSSIIIIATIVISFYCCCIRKPQENLARYPQETHQKQVKKMNKVADEGWARYEHDNDNPMTQRELNSDLDLNNDNDIDTYNQLKHTVMTTKGIETQSYMTNSQQQQSDSKNQQLQVPTSRNTGMQRDIGNTLLNSKATFQTQLECSSGQLTNRMKHFDNRGGGETQRNLILFSQSERGEGQTNQSVDDLDLQIEVQGHRIDEEASDRDEENQQQIPTNQSYQTVRMDAKRSSQMSGQFVSPGMEIQLDEAKSLIEKAIGILHEYDIEPTNEILGALNKLEQQSTSKDQFLTLIMRHLAQIVMSQVSNMPQEQRISSSLAEHYPTVQSDQQQDGSTRTNKNASLAVRPRMSSDVLFSELNTQSELGRDLARRISERFSVRVSQHDGQQELMQQIQSPQQNVMLNKKVTAPHAQSLTAGNELLSGDRNPYLGRQVEHNSETKGFKISENRQKQNLVEGADTSVYKPVSAQKSNILAQGAGGGGGGDEGGYEEFTQNQKVALGNVCRKLFEDESQTDAQGSLQIVFTQNRPNEQFEQFSNSKMINHENSGFTDEATAQFPEHLRTLTQTQMEELRKTPISQVSNNNCLAQKAEEKQYYTMQRISARKQKLADDASDKPLEQHELACDDNPSDNRKERISFHTGSEGLTKDRKQSQVMKNYQQQQQQHPITKMGSLVTGYAEISSNFGIETGGLNTQAVNSPVMVIEKDIQRQGSAYQQTKGVAQQPPQLDTSLKKSTTIAQGRDVGEHLLDMYTFDQQAQKLREDAERQEQIEREQKHNSSRSSLAMEGHGADANQEYYSKTMGDRADALFFFGKAQTSDDYGTVTSLSQMDQHLQAAEYINPLDQLTNRDHQHSQQEQLMQRKTLRDLDSVKQETQMAHPTMARYISSAKPSISQQQTQQQLQQQQQQQQQIKTSICMESDLVQKWKHQHAAHKKQHSTQFNYQTAKTSIKRDNSQKTGSRGMKKYQQHHHQQKNKTMTVKNNHHHNNNNNNNKQKKYFSTMRSQSQESVSSPSPYKIEGAAAYQPNHQVSKRKADKQSNNSAKGGPRKLTHKHPTANQSLDGGSNTTWSNKQLKMCRGILQQQQEDQHQHQHQQQQSREPSKGGGQVSVLNHTNSTINILDDKSGKAMDGGRMTKLTINASSNETLASIFNVSKSKKQKKQPLKLLIGDSRGRSINVSQERSQEGQANEINNNNNSNTSQSRRNDSNDTVKAQPHYQQRR